MDLSKISKEDLVPLFLHPQILNFLMVQKKSSLTTNLKPYSFIGIQISSSEFGSFTLYFSPKTSN